MNIKTNLLNLICRNTYLNDFIFSSYKKNEEYHLQKIIRQLQSIDTIQQTISIQEFRNSIENNNIFFSHNINNTNFRLYGIGESLFGPPVKKSFFYPAIEHGLILYPHAWSDTLSTARASIITLGDYRKEILRKTFNIPIFCVGPYIQYAKDYYSQEVRNILKQRVGKNLLVFISHGTDQSKVTYQIDKYLSILQSYKSKFDTITICSYWWDINSPLIKALRAAGFNITTAGFREDPCFLSRLKEIILLSDLVIGDSVGTHIGYCLSLNRPFQFFHINKQIIGQESTTEAEEERKIHIKKIQKAFSSTNYFSDEQIDLYNYYWGGNYTLTQSDLHKIAFFNECITKKAYGFTAQFANAANAILSQHPDTTCDSVTLFKNALL